MALSPGSTLGGYEILGLLGAGGMGEVYRARDTRLKREVAIKVLLESVADDADRVARFQREAELLATLNHPNIAAIYGLERHDGREGQDRRDGQEGRDRQEGGSGPYLVMELVAGEDLSQRIARGPIPIDDVLPIARQIALALETAHDRGVVHRDLKPANVKVAPDGAVKVLDFGLAKMLDSARAEGGGQRVDAGLSMSPTLSLHATYAGVILGTAAYMSPEQARGKPIDKRTDLWAFGCVLYEMLTGTKPFDGETLTDIVAAVVKNDPNWAALPAETPPGVRTVLRRCLQKDPSQRLRDAGDARIELDDHALDERPTGASPQPVSKSRERIAWVAAAVFALATAGATAWALRPVPPIPETRLEITTPSTNDAFSFAVSPDGRYIVFVAAGDGEPKLWLRTLDGSSLRPLPGTERAVYPFWSPDSKTIAFFASNSVRRIDLAGSPPQTIAPASGGRGGTWGSDGVILFATASTVLLRVPSSGGEPVPATTLAPGQSSHRFPQFLPGSRQFLFYARGIEESAGLYLGSLDSPEASRLTSADAAGFYIMPGWLLFTRQGVLVARHLDIASRTPTGEPENIADLVDIDFAASAVAFSSSTTGLMAYRTGGRNTRQLTWFDRSGKTLGVVGAPDTTGLSHPALSSDGGRIAAYRSVQGNTDVWLFDNARTTRFTVESGRDMYPLWSPDGEWILFSHDGKNPLDVYRKRASGAGVAELLVESVATKAPQSLTTDGRFFLYAARDPKSGGDLWVLPMNGERKPFPFVNSSFEERGGQFSPDGRWVAYESDESGRPEIYVRPFPGPGGQWQISNGGGITARWRHDGKELYYIAPDGKLMATPIAISKDVPEPGTPVALFLPHIANGGTSTVGLHWQYDVAADGRFLINVNVDEGGTAPITVIQNWRPKN